MELTFIEAILAILSWVALSALALHAWEATAQWWRLRQANPPLNLPPAGSHDRCLLCGGQLIGSERFHGTCGHCGQRSLDPWRNT